jgi:phosphosulfolactate synthase
MTTAFPMLGAPPASNPARKRCCSFRGRHPAAPKRLAETALDRRAQRSPTCTSERHRVWLRRKIALYDKFGIPVLPGHPVSDRRAAGVVYEYLKRVRDLGFAGVELSEDVIPPLAVSEREDIIAQARRLGLKVTTEVGRKNRDAAFDPHTIKRQILSDVELGASNVYIESSEIQALSEGDAEALDGLAALAGGSVVLFELGLINPQEKAAWLVERYGPLINFASVGPQDVVAVDAIRMGMHRKAGCPFSERSPAPGQASTVAGFSLTALPRGPNACATRGGWTSRADRAHSRTSPPQVAD